MLSRRFRIEHVVGVGAMGMVVAAHHLALDVRVALKLMLPELRDRPRFVGRFLREARAAARLTSRHAVRMFDVGTLEDGVPYIVMEYLDGVDLAAELRAHGPMAVEQAVAIVLQACHAVGEAHALGIIHRDLKPANLFVTRGAGGAPVIKVLDLGVCRLVDDRDDLGATSSTAVLGTPVYMAPEQLRSAHSADARSDVWSLGVILYELVTGRVPFRGEGVADQCARAMLDPYPAIGGPAAFEAVVARCLAKDPAARFQRVAELTAALEACVRRRWSRVRSWLGASVAAAAVAAMMAVSDEPPRHAVATPVELSCAPPPRTEAPVPRTVSDVVAPVAAREVPVRRVTRTAPVTAATPAFDPLSTAN